MELKEYFKQQYQGSESFLENVVYPIFGEESFEESKDPLLDNNPELATIARTTGIAAIERVGSIYIGVTRIDIFDIRVTSHVQLTRNRVGVQQLVRRIMGTYSSAFMIFHYDDNAVWDWRFTFCSKRDNSDTTDSKRYTFLLGPGQSCRTAADNFQKLFDKHGDITVEDIETAFDVEALSKEFFEKYKLHYERFVEYITGKRFVKDGGKWKEKVIHEPHAQMYADFGCDDKRVRDYVKKLLGRIVFLHFLQKKGWLGVPVGKQWGEGDMQFMKHLFDHSTPEQRADYLDTVLEPLFAQGIDTEREDGLYDTGVSLPYGSTVRIPYLNGGLFERDELDEVPTQFPEEFFADLMDFFYQYNFTIDENDPNDAQVGVDPEMLGRIFENLLEDNKDKGAFYTPKEIVQYMCRQSLTAYLQTNIEGEAERNAIAEFVETYNVSALPAELVDTIDLRLKDVKICDPAIGSGAFPMGLLKELFLCRGAIEDFSNATDIKRHIIQNNIYGVDIERGAVDIARLRFWLSLVVDEETPEALPNLDYKIMQGNSLLEQYKGFDLSQIASNQNDVTFVEPKRNLFGEIEDGQLAFTFAKKTTTEELLENLAKYFSEQDHAEKQRLREKIEKNVKDQILYNVDMHKGQAVRIVEELSAISADRRSKKQAKALEEALANQQYYECLEQEVNELQVPNDQFFLWHTYFADVFENGGFDIVIGNPPYGAKLSTEEIKLCKNVYKSAQTIKGIQKGSVDSFALFIEQSYNLSRHNGIGTLIVPLSITGSEAMEGIHNLLLSNCSTIAVSSYGDRPRRIFEGAEQQVSIISFRKTLTSAQQVLTTGINKRYSNEPMDEMLGKLRFVDSKQFVRKGRIAKIQTDTEVSILTKLLKASSTLSDLKSKDGLPVFYRKAGGRYYKVITIEPTDSSAEGKYVVSGKYQKVVGAILSCTLFYWFWLIHSDWHNLRSLELDWFPIPLEALDNDTIKKFGEAFDVYQEELNANSTTTKTGLKCFFARQSKAKIDVFDQILCPLYGLTKEETEFIINYDIAYRSSDKE